MILVHADLHPEEGGGYKRDGKKTKLSISEKKNMNPLMKDDPPVARGLVTAPLPHDTMTVRTRLEPRGDKSYPRSILKQETFLLRYLLELCFKDSSGVVEMAQLVQCLSCKPEYGHSIPRIHI